MKTGVTKEMQDYFANQYELLELISGEYIRSEKSELYKANIKHLFPNDKEQAKLINPGSYIAGIVYEWMSSYIGEPKENQDINYIDLIEGLLTTGYIRFFQNYSSKKLESINASKYFYDSHTKTEYFVNMYEQESDSSFSGIGKKYFLLVQTFSENILEKKLFELNSASNITEGTQVPLSTLDFLNGEDEKIQIKNLNRLVIEKQVERPILQKIKTIILSIEKKQAEIEKNFLDYTEQFKIFKNIKIPDNAYVKMENGIKVVNFDKLGKIITVEERNGILGGLEIVKNTNDLLIQSIEYIDKQIRSISAITGIPLYAFGIKIDGGNESGKSKQQTASLFYKKIEKYREVITKLFYQFWETFKIVDKEQLLEFGDIVTADINEIVDTQSKMINFGLQSRKRAIMKINSTDETEAKAIIQELIEENKLFTNNLKGQEM